MAIMSEKKKVGKTYFMHTFSDDNKRIKQVETGRVFDEAWDKTGAKYTYEETDEDIITDDGEMH